MEVGWLGGVRLGNRGVLQYRSGSITASVQEENPLRVIKMNEWKIHFQETRFAFTLLYILHP